MSLDPPSMLCSSQVLYQGRLRVRRMSVNQAALESVTVCPTVRHAHPSRQDSVMTD